MRLNALRRFTTAEPDSASSATTRFRSMNIKRSVGSGLTAIALALGASVVAAMPAHASTMLGGVNVDRACAWQHGTGADLVAWNVYGWRCIYHGAYITVNWGGVNLNQECASEYGSTAYARYLDYNNPYSWRCYR